MVADFLGGIFADNFSIRSNYLIFGTVSLFLLGTLFFFKQREKNLKDTVELCAMGVLKEKVGVMYV
ncbi:hypothetical protein [Streptococcus equinus]|uniref:hypothetical protein n=1 Tax=Streptococcus equinus TaxID=1335 RepID=UPI001F2B3106|nr:hypothetical protein [Streptococcus equinus]